MTAKKKSAPHSRAANAKETARRFGLRLQGSAREGVVILLLAACVFLLLALYSFRPEDPGWSRSGPETEVANWMGAFGAWLADVLYSLFGVSALWWPGMLGFAAWWLIRSRQVHLEWDATALAVRCGGLVLLLLGTTTLGALHFYHPESTLPYAAGGILGEGLVGALLPLVGSGGTSLLALAAILCGVPLFTGLSWLTVMDELGRLALLAWRWVAERFAFRRETEAEAVEEPAPRREAAPQPAEEPAGEPDQALRPAWWRRLLPGRAESVVPALQAAGGRRDPGFGDDGKTEIPWDVPERTPSAKRPEAAYTAREPKVSLEPSVSLGAATGVSPSRETPSAARRDTPEPLRATRDEPEPAEAPSSSATAPRASAFVTPKAPPSADPAPREPSLSARDERPSPAPTGPDEPRAEARPAATGAEGSESEPTDEDAGAPHPPGTPRRVPEVVHEPILPDDDDAPLPPWQAGAQPAPAEPASPRPAPPERASRPGTPPPVEEPPAADDDAARQATAEQAREAADDDDGPTLWTVEHLQNQRPEMEAFADPEGELPSLRLLTPPQSHQPNYTDQQLAEMAELLEVRLREYGVKAEVVDTWPGPVITRFEIKPAAGVKVSKISNLAKDLARSLMVKSVRVVEVIPGRPTVGIEIPNPHRAMIRLREVIDSDRYQHEASALTLALGQDIGGGPVVANLGKMPHLLVAGTTGSGKSVGVNAMLISMLLKAKPDEVRMIMVDPKMLELSVYDGIPHLLAPVVTDMKEAANALRWCVAEMERRYKLMAAMGVRNIAGFNAKLDEADRAGAQVADPLWEPQPWEMHQAPPVLEKLPYIVVVIDEFADMFMIVGKKVEELIARLAQKARAAGIHLILATQRPSVDVVTGLIKANIPTRMAFQVSSRVDSRTILDQGGAENLLGHGDMLYLPAGSGMPTRVHGAFVDDDEVHRVVEDWKRRGEPEYIEEILSGGVSADALAGLEAEGGGGDDDAEQDALYDEAVAFVTESRRASISAVQRRFKIGYNRAARLVEAMEMAGVVSTMGTNGAREVLAPPPAGD
ncbi:DNA translocase FtsK [Halomonas sp. M4R1S46]|uniref:DNA translocase FtsK n=1 Tax=Halomonas sp. M4R1S46 TaxID=2982692 RepID=UPI0021E4722D|nr:DNA translocase FtsK 4TM domain-containing protein [Halomonas sp. M4R1S46]UYG06432.1 DNA translocase FtsK 4TM domain-containing protein [Halomonas sp. M4R1S46]